MSSGYTAAVIELPDENGAVTIRKVDVSGDNSLTFLQQTVGGYIEHLYSDDRQVDFWLNEEGKLERLPINNVATDLLWALNPAFVGRDVLVGPVVLTGNNGPETASIKPEVWEWLKALEWEVPVEFVEESNA
jgi:hypothetical protein